MAKKTELQIVAEKELENLKSLWTLKVANQAVVAGEIFKLALGAPVQVIEGLLLDLSLERRLYKGPYSPTAEAVCFSPNGRDAVVTKTGEVQFCPACESQAICSRYGQMYIGWNDTLYRLQIPPKRVQILQYLLLVESMRGNDKIWLRCSVKDKKLSVEVAPLQEHIKLAINSDAEFTKQLPRLGGIKETSDA